MAHNSDISIMSIIFSIINSGIDKNDVINHTIASKNIREAIKKAFLSMDDKGNLPSEQRIIGRRVLAKAYNQFHNRFLVNLDNGYNFLFSMVNSGLKFENLLKMMDLIRVHRFGELAKYDIALRIAFYLKEHNQIDCLPEKIYLLRESTKRSYKFIFNDYDTKNIVTIKSLKNNIIGASILKTCLAPWQIEILLHKFDKAYNYEKESIINR